MVTAGLTGGFVYSNSFNHISEVFALHEELNLGPSLVIYDCTRAAGPGFLLEKLA